MKKFAAASAMIFALSTGAQADVIRHTTPGSNFPILRAVEIPPEATLVYLSGVVPGVTNPDAPRGSAEAYGDTRAQAASVLERIAANLEELDLGMGDVVKMQVFLVADASGQMDFAGFMEAYSEFFATDAQPNMPTRTVMEVAGLASPNWLVEIEVVAVRP